MQRMRLWLLLFCAVLAGCATIPGMTKAEKDAQRLHLDLIRSSVSSLWERVGEQDKRLKTIEDARGITGSEDNPCALNPADLDENGQKIQKWLCGGVDKPATMIAH